MYQNLYSIPCRLPCNRYTDPNDVFEAAAPSPQQQHENFQPSRAMKRVARQQQAVQPISERYDYDSRTFNESYEYEPTIERETFEETDCECSVNNPPYRMQECDYNQSPSWDNRSLPPYGGLPTTNMRSNEAYSNIKGMNTGAKNILLPQGVSAPSGTPGSAPPPIPIANQVAHQTNSQPSCDCSRNNLPYRMEGCGYNQSASLITQNMFNNQALSRSMPQQMPQIRDVPIIPDSANCNCSMNNPSYQIGGCDYNRSPTWTDQSSFRENVQNKY